MPITGLEHIAIVVKSLDSAKHLFGEVLGLGEPKVIEMKEEGFRIGFFSFNGVELELLEPLNPNTTIGRFLEKRGEGLHHICLKVSNIEEVLARLKKRGVEVLDEKPRIGARGHRIAFLAPKSCHSVLIELCEEKG